jgi:hypothetical protein
MAHAFGLGHTTDQTDIMYPVLNPAQVTGFQGKSMLQNDGSGQCGDGSGYQDSKQMLLDVMGASKGNPMGGPQPTVQFITPTDGSTVPNPFMIQVSASESGGSIAKVDVADQASGTTVASWTAAPYSKTGVKAMMDGSYQLTATAYDAAGNFSSATVSFTVKTGAPPQMPPGSSGNCSTPCPAGTTCQSDGTCAPSGVGGGGGGSGAGAIGSACTVSGDCASGVCGQLGSHQFCTQVCDPSNKYSCPSGNQCVTAGSDHYCEPDSLAGGHGGCAFGGAPASGEAILAAWLLAVSLVLSRRRRSRSF